MRAARLAFLALFATSAIGAGSVGCSAILGTDFDHGARTDQGDAAASQSDANGDVPTEGEMTSSPSTGVTSAMDSGSSATKVVPIDGGESNVLPSGDDDDDEADGGVSTLPTDAAVDAGAKVNLYKLTSDGADAGIAVADSLVLYINGTKVTTETADASDVVAPVSFHASVGDHVVVEFFETQGGPKQHSAIYLSSREATTQELGASFSGVGTYPADTYQPYDVLPFAVPASGKTATIECVPSFPLNTGLWPNKNQYLQIRTATSVAYDLTWTANNHLYNYVPDCQGWVSDVFVDSDQSAATVSWNTITHALQTWPVSGRTYSAQEDAEFAVSTLYPGGDLNLLTVH